MKIWPEILFFLAFGINAFGLPVVTDVQDPTFSKVESDEYRTKLQELRQVDFERYPELKRTYQQIIELVENLLIKEDGTRPIRVVFVDNMMLNAFFYGPRRGDRVLGIHLGLLKYLRTDDQLAWLLGHELEHGLSVLERQLMNEPQRHNPLLRRVIENEVDVKSIFNRVHANGMNPYGSLDALEILKELYGDDISDTHTMTSNRMNTMEQALTGMTRVIGERINQSDRTEIITPSLRALLDSGDFLQRRKKTVEMAIPSYKEKISHLLGEIKKLESVSAHNEWASFDIRNEFSRIKNSFSRNRATVDEQLYGIASDAVILDYRLQYESAFAGDLFEGIARAFGDDMEIGTARQFEIIHDIMTMKIFENPLMIGGSYSTPLGDIDRDIMDTQGYTGISEQEQSSRWITIERELEKLKSKRRLLESGFEDPDAAQRISVRIKQAKESNTSPQRSNLSTLRREFENNIRHIGRWISRGEELMANLSFSYFNSFFRWFIGVDSFRNESFQSMYKYLPLEKARSYSTDF